MKAQKRRGAIAAAVIAVIAVGSSVPTVAATTAPANSSSISASVIHTLKTGTPAQKKAALAGLSRAQQIAVLTPTTYITSTGLRFTKPSASLSPTQDVATAEEITPVSTPALQADAVGAVNKAKKCSQGYSSMLYWIDVQNAFGLRLYRWHDDIAWYWNCQVITIAQYHHAYASDMLPPFETHKATTQDTMTKAGTPNGVATGTGEMAACVGFSFFSGCFDNSEPTITISYDAFGNSEMTGYGV